MTTVIILAAGRGSRLNPLTEAAPKCLTELGGISLIESQLNTLRSAGLEDIIIVTGYRSEMLKIPGTRRLHNANWAKTNMVETLFIAEKEFCEDILICYSDILYERRIIDSLLVSSSDISVAINTNWEPLWNARFEDPLSDAESLRIDNNSLITEIGNRVTDVNDIQGQFTGLLRVKRTGIVALRKAFSGLRTAKRPWKRYRNAENAYMTDVLMELILFGEEVKAIPNAGGWIEIDTMCDFELYNRMLKAGSLVDFYNPDQFLQ